MIRPVVIFLNIYDLLKTGFPERITASFPVIPSSNQQAHPDYFSWITSHDRAASHK